MLYKRDFRLLSNEEAKGLEEAKAYVRSRRGTGLNPMELQSYHDLMPLAAYHYESLFPNNLLSINELEHQTRLMELKLAFSNLLDLQCGEREVLNFLVEHQAYFIIGSIFQSSYDFGHHQAFAFKEFELPPNFVVDYLLVGKNSGGYEFVFVELESPQGAVTNNDGSFGSVIRKGLKQIEDWDAWLDSNFAHLHLQFKKSLHLTALPEEFSHLDKSRIHYAIVAGRRKDFNDRTYRLRRKLLKERNISLLHYDNLLDATDLLLKVGNY